VLCRDAEGSWILPGGTREQGESVDDCAARELAEEAGARLAGPLQWIGAHYAVTDEPVPYRPWQPHPHKAWLWCAADVVVDSVPTNPADAEQIVEVLAAEPAEAQRLIRTHSEWLGELLELAGQVRRRTGLS
jgi:8-oxo-dGTP diphosphatase